MTESLYFTTEMPTESFDDLAPAPVVLEMGYYNISAPSKPAAAKAKPRTFLDPAEEMECRVALLEVALQNHALEIRDRMAARIAQLEEKLEIQSGELHRSLRQERLERKDEFEELSCSVSNAIDRVENAALAGIEA